MFLVQTTLEEQAHTQSYRHRGLVAVWSAAGIVSLPVRMLRPLLPLTASQLPAIYFPWRVLGQQRRAGSPLVGQSSRRNKWTPHLQRHELGEPCEHTWDCPLSSVTSGHAPSLQTQPPKWSRKHHPEQSPSHPTQQHSHAIIPGGEDHAL